MRRELTDEEIIRAIREEALKDRLKEEEKKYQEKQGCLSFFWLLLTIIVLMALIIYSKTH